jgi:hypothetical protein
MNDHSAFKQYRRSAIAELRPVTDTEITNNKCVPFISVSSSDLENGSPKQGDMIARNPANHNDQWLVAADYFKNNFEEIK